MIDLNLVPRWREQAERIEASLLLDHHPEVFWRFLATNEVMSQLAGKPLTTFSRVRTPHGLTLLQASFRLLGMKLVAYDLPYEWTGPAVGVAEMIHESGALQFTRFDFRTSFENGRWRLHWDLHYVPRRGLSGLLAGPLARYMHKGFLEALELTNQTIKPGETMGFETGVKLAEKDVRRVADLAAAWANLMPDSDVPRRVAHFVLAAPNAFVRTMRPFVIADYYGLPRLDVLRFCLRATKAGYLDMAWDLICPSCRGATRQAESLGDVDADAHCESCDVNFAVDFDNHVEVTFRPRPQWRVVAGESYCLSSAGNTPHVVAQVNLEPGATRSFTLRLSPGEYRMRAFYTPGERRIVCEEGASAGEASIEVGEGVHGDLLRTGGELRLTLHNASTLWRTVKVEHLAFRDQAATARQVTSLQEFRNLFGAEVLRPGVQLGVSNLVLLFSDLKDSTALYESRGDASAFSLVHDHFEILRDVIDRHGGGIVKTIGDAVMAVFEQPAAACEASLEILDAFAKWNRTHPDRPIVIKLGLHRGPCIALNLNDRLDYFGSTVNKAARVQGTSQGGDLVVSDAIYDAADAQSVLARTQITPMEAQLKGIGGKSLLYRCIPAAETEPAGL